MNERDDRAPSFPEGTYRAHPEPDSVSMCGAEGSAGEQISVVMRVVDEDFPTVKGKSIRWFGNFTNQKAISISTDSLRIMGWDGKSPVGADPGDLAGLGSVFCEIVVLHEEYDGKTRAKVKYVNAIGGVDPFAKKKPLAPTDKAKLNERIRRFMGTPQTEAKPDPRRAPAGTTPPFQAPNMPASRTTAPIVMSDEERLRLIDQGIEPTVPVTAPLDSEADDDDSDSVNDF